MERFEAVVVGAGVMGASTARSLARRGVKTALVERFEPGHRHGSSHGTSRIFRFSYPEPRYVEMARAALDLLRALEEEAGVPLVHVTGGLDAGPGAEENARALAKCGIEHEFLAAAEVATRWDITYPDGAELLFQPQGAVLYADRVWRSTIDGALAYGCRFLPHTRVQEIQETSSGVKLFGPRFSVQADVAVLTVGPWAPELLGAAGFDTPLVATRQTIAHYRLAGPTPPTVVDWTQPMVYALESPGIGLKVGEHVVGEPVDPETEPAADEDTLERLDEWVRKRFPHAGPRAAVETCFYTNAPGEEFLLTRRGHVIAGSPCSGHGFKFAPLIGERLADLVS